MNTRCKYLLVAAAMCVVSLAIADDDVPLHKAPPGVQATVKRFVGHNKFDHLDKDVDNGKTVYEVDVNTKNDGNYSVHMSDTGEVLGISHDVAMEMVPDVVLDAANAAHPDAKTTEPEIRWVDGKLFYKLEQKVGKDKHELSIDGSGKILADEKEAEDDGGDDAKKP